MKIHRQRRQGAFTLIELLVVITIIAILASIATPVMSKVQLSARMTKASSNARNIFLACQLYAADSGGSYPEGEGTSNDAFRKLFPEYSEQEEPFFLVQDKYFCRGAGADENIGDPDSDDESTTSPEALKPGENHWAYVTGLLDTDNVNTPIIADGFTGGNNTYDENHAWWKAKKALLIKLDGSQRREKIYKSGEVRVPDKNRNTNMFAASELGRGLVLNPAKP